MWQTLDSGVFFIHRELAYSKYLPWNRTSTSKYNQCKQKTFYEPLFTWQIVKQCIDKKTNCFVLKKC